MTPSPVWGHTTDVCVLGMSVSGTGVCVCVCVVVIIVSVRVKRFYCNITGLLSVI